MSRVWFYSFWPTSHEEKKKFGKTKPPQIKRFTMVLPSFTIHVLRGFFRVDRTPNRSPVDYAATAVLHKNESSEKMTKLRAKRGMTPLRPRD